MAWAARSPFAYRCHDIIAQLHSHTASKSRMPIASIHSSTSRTKSASVSGPVTPAGPQCSQPAGASTCRARMTSRPPKQQPHKQVHRWRLSPTAGCTSAPIMLIIGRLKSGSPWPRGRLRAWRNPPDTSAMKVGRVTAFDMPTGRIVPPPHNTCGHGKQQPHGAQDAHMVPVCRSTSDR